MRIGGAPVPPILPPQNGYLFLDRTKFHAAFAADVADRAVFTADSQVPWGVEALSGAVTRGENPCVEDRQEPLSGGSARAT